MTLKRGESDICAYALSARSIDFHRFTFTVLHTPTFWSSYSILTFATVPTIQSFLRPITIKLNQTRRMSILGGAARQIFDSRGNPTVEVDLHVEGEWSHDQNACISRHGLWFRCWYIQSRGTKWCIHWCPWSPWASWQWQSQLPWEICSESCCEHQDTDWSAQRIC